MKFNYLMCTRSTHIACECGRANEIELVLAYFKSHEHYLEQAIRALQKAYKLHDRETWTLYVDYQLMNYADIAVDAEESRVHLLGLKPLHMQRERDINKQLAACGFYHAWNGLLMGACSDPSDPEGKLRTITFKELTQLGVPIPESGKWGNQEQSNETS